MYLVGVITTYPMLYQASNITRSTGMLRWILFPIVLLDQATVPFISLPCSQFLNFLLSPFIVIIFFINSLVLVTMHVCALSVALLGLVALVDTSPCPEVIKSSISYGSYGRDKALPALYKTLTSCPGVRALNLKISQGGCVIVWTIHGVSSFLEAIDIPRSKA